MSFDNTALNKAIHCLCDEKRPSERLCMASHKNGPCRKCLNCGKWITANMAARMEKERNEDARALLVRAGMAHFFGNLPHWTLLEILALSRHEACECESCCATRELLLETAERKGI